MSRKSALRDTDGLGGALTTIAGNLIENAFDAVEGQARREVTVVIRDESNVIRLEVRDSGRGVSRQLRPHIFTAGFSTKGNGHVPRGLGLALVKRLVVEHGGAVSVRNDNGALFSVRLPRRIAVLCLAQLFFRSGCIA